MILDDIILSIFPDVTTHLKHVKGEDLSHIMPYDRLISVLAVTYSRYTVRPMNESKVSRIVYSILLGILAYYRLPYWIQVLSHLLSFAPQAYRKLLTLFFQGDSKDDIKYLNKKLQALSILGGSYIVLGEFLFSLFNPQFRKSWFSSTMFQSTRLGKLALYHFLHLLGYFIPVAEFQSAHDILLEFMDKDELYMKSAHLLFVTVHIQIAMGYLGIAFLRSEQTRKNALVKIEDEVKQQREAIEKDTASKSKEPKDPSEKFRRGAGPFIFFVALPYMFQIVFYGATNMYAFHCFRDDLHRKIRLNDLFSSNGSHFVATAAASGVTLSPGTYATNVEKVVTTVYDLVNQNLFSVPKLLLLPSIIAKQPKLAASLTPLIIFSDYLKSVIVSTITTEQERLNNKVRDITARRTKVEQFDLKNAELIQRSGHGSVSFTERHWVSYTERIQDLNAKIAIMKRTKQYFQWLQRNFIMMALVDCALARLIAVGKILAADIFVYARAVEDMINFVLMKSKAESELAGMVTSIEVLQNLKNIWNESEKRNLLDCQLSDDNTGTIHITGLSYSRGAASVSIKDISISAGIYAVTGSNGSGKSTLFRLIMGCDTNRESVDIHSSITINQKGMIVMPSSNVVEITQNFYFPLFTAPVDWINNVDLFEKNIDGEREVMAKRLEIELNSLKFYPATTRENTTSLYSDLISVRDDWFSDLSGGQKSKVELVRKVFLAEECPKVLLIDEAFAPLDPDSKSFVMQKLKSFCSQSIVLVIYHADVKGSDTDDSLDDECVESSNFFDGNLHVQDGALTLRSVC